MRNKERDMSWNKEGLQIVGMYHGQRVQGTVETSRVKYGGGVQHLVILDEPVQLRWRTEPTDRLLIDDNELIEE
jgi:hypothetical protein